MGDRAVGAAPVVDVDVADRHRPPRSRRDHHRDARRGDLAGEGVVVVEADEEGAVDVAGGEVVGRPVRLARGRRHEEDQLEVARGERRADPAEEPREERVREHEAARFGDDDADRVAAAGHEAPGGPVGDVARARRRGLDGRASRRRSRGANR
jgi:hypothetical protein